MSKLFLLNVYITVNAKIHGSGLNDFGGRLTGLLKKETVDVDSENDHDITICQALSYTCGF